MISQLEGVGFSLSVSPIARTPTQVNTNPRYTVIQDS
jgi:hypothetical protein